MTKPLPTTPAGDPTTIPELHARHAAEERALVRSALERSGWGLADAAAVAGVAPSTLQRMISRLGLTGEYQARNRGPGRPRKERGLDEHQEGLAVWADESKAKQRSKK